MSDLARTRRRPHSSVLVGLACVLAIGVRAQVRQSTEADLRWKEWHSPVTVEIPIVGAVNAPLGSKWVVPAVPQFYCDDVTIEEIAITKLVPKKSGDSVLRVMTRLWVRAQEDDKAVSLEFALIEGDRTEFLGRIEGIDGQAGDTKTVWESFGLAKEVFDRYFSEERNPILKVSMIVRTN